MQIGQYIAENTSLQDNIKLEHTKTIERNTQVKSSNELSGFKEGAVFKGEILDITGDKVKIALDNKAQLMARLQEGVELGVGDRLLFSVKENTANQILIKPMFDSLYSAQTQVLERALDMAGLSPTEKNFAVAKELMEAGLPVDKGSLVKLLSQSMKFEGTSMQTLVALNKMNIPVTEANLAQFERYQGYHHQLSGDIGQAADSMASFAEAFPADTSSETLLSVANEVIDLLTQKTGTGEQAVEASKAGSLEENAVMQSETESVVQEEVSSVRQETEDRQGLVDSSKQFPMQRDGLTSVDYAQSKEAKAYAQAEPNLEEEIEVDLKDAEWKKNEVLPEKLGLSKEQVSNLLNLLKKAGISEAQSRTMMHNAEQPETFLKDIVEELSTTPEQNEAIRNVMESNEFKKMFSDVVKKHWALDPKEMKDPKEIDELYNKIAKQSRAFEHAIESKGGETGSFSQNFQNMRQNMQFMEQLNQQMIYAQMPLTLSNQNANSELFVYADKRKLMEKKDGISVMLHLDMDHLGMTDIKVTLTGTNVNARFYLNDQESVDIVADNMVQLAKQLADRGFSLTNEVVKRTPQESINQVVDEMIDENAERSIKRYTFDART